MLREDIKSRAELSVQLKASFTNIYQRGKWYGILLIIFFFYNMLFSSDVTEYAAEKLYFMLVTIKRDWLKC